MPLFYSYFTATIFLTQRELFFFHDWRFALAGFGLANFAVKTTLFLHLCSMKELPIDKYNAKKL